MQAATARCPPLGEGSCEKVEGFWWALRKSARLMTRATASFTSSGGTVACRATARCRTAPVSGMTSRSDPDRRRGQSVEGRAPIANPNAILVTGRKLFTINEHHASVVQGRKALPGTAEIERRSY